MDEILSVEEIPIDYRTATEILDLWTRISDLREIFTVKEIVHVFNILIFNKHTRFNVDTVILISCEYYHAGTDYLIRKQGNQDKICN
jgi:hypothetical protein